MSQQKVASVKGNFLANTAINFQKVGLILKAVIMHIHCFNLPSYLQGEATNCPPPIRFKFGREAE